MPLIPTVVCSVVIGLADDEMVSIRGYSTVN